MGQGGDPRQLRGPGLILTQTLRDNSDTAFQEYALSIARSPRLGQPEDIAAAVAFLMSEDGSWVNGQVWSVDGGSTLRP